MAGSDQLQLRNSDLEQNLSLLRKLQTEFVGAGTREEALSASPQQRLAFLKPAYSKDQLTLKKMIDYFDKYETTEPNNKVSLAKGNGGNVTILKKPGISA